MGDIARAVLFSSSFPDIKPLEQLTFEVKAKHLISEELEDLDELDPKKFKSEDSHEDEGDVYESLTDWVFWAMFRKTKCRHN